ADLLRISSSASWISVMSRSELRSILSTTHFLELLEALCQKRSNIKNRLRHFLENVSEFLTCSFDLLLLN
ncbi:hypothetical protein, partial [Halalkalibacter flavus]|uniref:hypothetical protein n=1 Tax=Halalkalibacter flavus TaxID=3090668 RepID=UPI002FC5E63C